MNLSLNAKATALTTGLVIALLATVGALQHRQLGIDHRQALYATHRLEGRSGSVGSAMREPARAEPTRRSGAVPFNGDGIVARKSVGNDRGMRLSLPAQDTFAALRSARRRCPARAG